eukprot:12883459-Prorocentrum_lima.AAC.1
MGLVVLRCWAVLSSVQCGSLVRVLRASHVDLESPCSARLVRVLKPACQLNLLLVGVVAGHRSACHA